MNFIIGRRDGHKYRVLIAGTMQEAEFRAQFRHILPKNKVLNFKLWVPCYVEQGNGSYAMQLVERRRIYGEMPEPILGSTVIQRLLDDIALREKQRAILVGGAA